jgi:hypothetical protein
MVVSCPLTHPKNRVVHTKNLKRNQTRCVRGQRELSTNTSTTMQPKTMTAIITNKTNITDNKSCKMSTSKGVTCVTVAIQKCTVTIKKSASSQEKIKQPHALFFLVMSLLLILKKRSVYVLMESRCCMWAIILKQLAVLICVLEAY